MRKLGLKSTNVMPKGERQGYSQLGEMTKQDSGNSSDQSNGMGPGGNMFLSPENQQNGVRDACEGYANFWRR